MHDKKIDDRKNAPPFTGHFNGYDDAQVRCQAHCPDAACPGLPLKPLDATIGQVFAPYRSGGCHGHQFLA